MTPTFDIAIVGGGMVGASLAVALAPLGLKVALVEAVAYDSASQPSFDERTTALSNGSRRNLETLGGGARGEALGPRLRAGDGIEVFCPAQVSRVVAHAHAVTLEIAQDGRTAALDA